MKLRITFNITSLILFALVMTACNIDRYGFGGGPGTITFSVAHSGDGCVEGVQGSLTILSDQSVFSSALLKEEDDYYIEQSEQLYNGEPLVRVEAYCYEANGIQGKIIVEGKLRNTYPYNRNRNVHVSPNQGGGFDKPFQERCISDPPFNTEDFEVNVIEQVKPFPCIDGDWIGNGYSI